MSRRTGSRFSSLPSGWWRCEWCGTYNASARRVCGDCGKPRTKATDGPPAHADTPACVGQRAATERPTVRRRTRAEAVYLASLESRKASGAVAGWIEQPTLPLPDGARYRPDFLVFFPRGPGLPPRVEVHEVKGGHVKRHIAWSEAGVARYRAARALLPWLRFRMFVVEGETIREDIER